MLPLPIALIIFGSRALALGAATAAGSKAPVHPRAPDVPPVAPRNASSPRGIAGRTLVPGIPITHGRRQSEQGEGDEWKLQIEYAGETFFDGWDFFSEPGESRWRAGASAGECEGGAGCWWSGRTEMRTGTRLMAQIPAGDVSYTEWSCVHCLLIARSRVADVK
jgi:hypothetical protein